MIDKNLVREVVNQNIAGTDCFVVDVTVSTDNKIVVEIDSETDIDIDFCVNISRKIEESFNRDVEDYELEVGSAGITSPFKVQAQYQKNLGKEVEVLSKDGRKFSGILSLVEDEYFAVEVTKMVKLEGAKRKTPQTETIELGYDDVKYVRAVLEF